MTEVETDALEKRVSVLIKTAQCHARQGWPDPDGLASALRDTPSSIDWTLYFDVYHESCGPLFLIGCPS